MTVKENNQEKVGAHVLINCGIDEKEALLDKISNLENVAEINNVSGNYGIITKINANNTKSLMTTRDEIEKIVSINSAVMLIHTDLPNPYNITIKKSISDKDKNDNSTNYDYTCCDQCGLLLHYCHCTCSYCGERDSCECALFDAATGG